MPLLRSCRPWLFALPAAILGLCLYNLRITGWGLEHIPGDAGDARFINYLLEHGYRAMGGQHAFWDAPFMYPQQNVLAFSDNMLGSLPVYSLFRLLGNDRETAYQLWWMSMSLLNFGTCYFVLGRLQAHPLAAALGAFVFAYGLFNQGQMSYLQMNVRFAVPLVLYYAWLTVTQPATKHYLLYCLWTVVQFYCIVYTGLMVFYLSLLLVAICLPVYKKSDAWRFYFRKQRVVYTAGISLATVALLYLLFKPYIAISAITGLRLFSEVVPTLPLLSSWFFAHESSYTWHFLSGHLKSHLPDWYLHTIFPGLLPLAAFLMSGIYLLRQRLRKMPVPRLVTVLFFTALVAFVFFLRTANGHTAYAVIFKLPGLNSMRVLSRVVHVEIFLWLALMALLLTMVFNRLKGHYKTMGMGLAVLLVLADNVFDAGRSLRTSKKQLQQRVLDMSRQIREQNTGQRAVLAVVNNGAQAAYLTHLDAMLAAQELGMPCINGYSSYCPDAFGPFFLHPGKNELHRWMQASHTDSNRVFVLSVNR